MIFCIVLTIHFSIFFASLSINLDVDSELRISSISFFLLTFSKSCLTKSFSVTPKESLNDGMGNGGVYDKGEFSYQGTLASEDLAQYAISPGKAFVKGYEVETISTTYLDCPKPRTSETLHHQGINYNTGRQLQINGAYGLPEVGIGNTYIVSLRDQRVSKIFK